MPSIWNATRSGAWSITFPGRVRTTMKIRSPSLDEPVVDGERDGKVVDDERDAPDHGFAQKVEALLQVKWFEITAHDVQRGTPQSFPAGAKVPGCPGNRRSGRWGSPGRA